METLPTKGVYTLIILLKAKSLLKVRNLGSFSLQKGYYAYTGSALGDGATSLRRRVERHLKKEKTRYWHFDFLTANKNVTVAAIVAAESSTKKECQTNNLIKDIEGATIPVAGFGASDCKQNCGSHLVFFGEEDIREEITDAYAHLFGRNKVSKVSLIPSK